MTIRLVDSHCHLADPVFDPDRHAVLERAAGAGVTAALVMAEDLAENRRVLDICRLHSILHPCLGHYPARLDPAMAAASATLIREHRAELAGIGEVGLDYRLAEDADARRTQREILALFAHLSREVDLTLSVHSRSAGHHTIDLLIAEGARRVVMHAFDGRAVHARRGADHGFYFSIPPSIVRSRQKEKLVKALPLDRMLLESDAPVLGPDPDQRNEPANIVVAARAVAGLHDTTLEEVARVTTANAETLFSTVSGG